MERRDFYRINLPVKMCGKIAILRADERVVNNKAKKICIIDISAGGFKFRTDLDFPIDGEVYKLGFSLYDEEYEIEGKIKWKNRYKHIAYDYGVEFTPSEKERDALVNKITSLMNDTKRHVDGIYDMCPKRYPNLFKNDV